MRRRPSCLLRVSRRRGDPCIRPGRRARSAARPSPTASRVNFASGWRNWWWSIEPGSLFRANGFGGNVTFVADQARSFDSVPIGIGTPLRKSLRRDRNDSPFHRIVVCRGPGLTGRCRVLHKRRRSRRTTRRTFRCAGHRRIRCHRRQNQDSSGL